MIKLHVQTVQDEQNKMRESLSSVKSELENLQQYGRRQNLRIYGIPVEECDTPPTLAAKVLPVLNDVCENSTDIGRLNYDRFHRVGKVKVDENGVKQQAVIIRFPTFRERTLVYKARKGIKQRLRYGISLDLTHERLEILNEARELVEENEDIEFAYADVNCMLRVFTKQGKHLMFDSISELQGIISSL